MEPPRHQDTKGCVSDPRLDVIAKQIVDAAFVVHSTLGAGLLESVYEQCLAFEIEQRRMKCGKQISIPVTYKSLRIEAAEKLLPVHEAQLLTYMKLTGKRLGFLINFNVPRIKEGIRRFAL